MISRPLLSVSTKRFCKPINSKLITSVYSIFPVDHVELHTGTGFASRITLCNSVPYNFVPEDLEHQTVRCFSASQTHTSTENFKTRISEGPSLEYFVSQSAGTAQNVYPTPNSHPYISFSELDGQGKKVLFEVYGCQMNVSDADIAWSVLKSHNYVRAESETDADIILIMTCAIREGAEQKIWRKLTELRALKRKKKKPLKVGVLGCMAERLKTKLLEEEKVVDVVAGPDSYRDLPRLLAAAKDSVKAINVMLSLDETYADIAPVSLAENKVSSFISIMRGCNNMCTYCIVPFTRGRERSRDIQSILNEVKYLSEQGMKEVVLLGQNVNSYQDMSVVPYSLSSSKSSDFHLSKGFKTICKTKPGGLRFADLLDKVSQVDGEMRIRFTSPHPKDFPDPVLEVIRDRPNICKSVHLPAQCGNNRILELMRRGYTRESYMDLVDHIRSLIPNISLSSDFICGFCTETENEFEDTLSLIKYIKYNLCYLFAYSLREKTPAHRKYEDSVPLEVKKERLQRMHVAYREAALSVNSEQIGQRQLVLIEGFSKKSLLYLAGRNDGNTKVIIPASKLSASNSETSREVKPGDYVEVLITDANSQVLKGKPLCLSSIQKFHTQPAKCIGQGM